jgi:pimeloyl-ACP methyl ester carboxylesterase
VIVQEDGPSDGPPILLLHGFGGSLYWWGQVVPLLADRFRLIRVDLLGHGGTGGAAADAPEQARAVERVLDSLGVSAVTAVGHSFGADVAVELAERSDRIDRLVLVCQAPDYSEARMPRGNLLMTLPVVAPALHRLAPAVITVLSRFAPKSARGPAAQAVRDVRALDVRMFRVVLRDRPTRMAARPLDEQVRSAGKPTLVVLGGRDHFYGARSAKRYAAAGATVEILDRSGHSPNIEMPAELARLVAEFAAPEAVVGKDVRR